MATAAVTSNQLESLPQPSSQPTSPALYSSFNQPSRTPSFNMYSARSQGSLPGTPTTSTHNYSILDVPSGMTFADFLRTWSDLHVSTWLTNVKCGHHSTTFRASDIRGDILLDLDQVTLKEIGIFSVGDRLRIVNAVKHLRQRCSNRGERASTFSVLHQRTVLNTNEGDLGHRRTGSETSPISRSAARRHEHGRPPPLQLGSSTNPQPNLPHIIRDNSDSLRPNPVRPLPHPVPVAPSSSTPVVNAGSSQPSNSRAPHLPLPPVPRGHPPPPPSHPPPPPSPRPSNRTFP